MLRPALLTLLILGLFDGVQAASVAGSALVRLGVFIAVLLGTIVAFVVAFVTRKQQ